MIVFITRLKSIPKNSALSRKAYKLAILLPILAWTPTGEAQSLTSRLKDGVGLACEKEGNTNRKVYRSFFKISKDRKIVATLDYSCLLYTSPSPRDGLLSRMPSSA